MEKPIFPLFRNNEYEILIAKYKFTKKQITSSKINSNYSNELLKTHFSFQKIKIGNSILNSTQFENHLLI